MPVKVTHTHHLELGENAFWIVLWTMAAIALNVLLAICLYWDNKNDELIAKSREPIETRCALASGSNVTQQCQALLISKRGN